MRVFGSRYPQWGKHQIAKQQNDQKSPLHRVIPYEFVCELCEQRWLSAESVTRRCPGLPVYWWPLDARKPDYLITATELKVLGLSKPKMPPAAYLIADLYPTGTEWTPLYDQREMKTEKDGEQ